MSMDEVKHYTTVEIAIYQILAAQGSYSTDKLSQVHAELLENLDRFSNPEVISQLEGRTLEDSIELINERIKFINEKITKTTHQTEQTKYFMLLRSSHHVASQDDSSNGNANSNLNTLSFTPREIQAINRIIDFIFTENDVHEKYLLTGKEALRIVSSETAYTATQCQRFLHRLVTEGFIVQHKSDRYMLSMKTLVELKDHLVQQYSIRKEGGLVNICTGCNEIQTIGVRCPNFECWVRLHKHCYAPYTRAKGRVCRNCGTNWEDQTVGGMLPVGEMCLRSND